MTDGKNLMWVYLNDRFVNGAEATVSVFDHGFLYGDGVYETIRTYGGRFFMLQAHLARLDRSASLIGLTLPLPERDWPALLTAALDRNGLGPAPDDSAAPADAHVRITVSRGEGELGLDPALCAHPTLLIMAKPLTLYPPRLFEEGVTLLTATVRRNLVAALSPQIKSTSFLNNILAKREAVAAGTFDSLMLNAEGHLAECTTSNLFFVRKGRLCTPAVTCGILDGITREIVLLLAREAGLPVEEGRYEPEHVRRAEECFLTNTSMELMPVKALDGAPIGSGRPGPVTAQLRALFQANRSRFLTA